jgi:hypothetical protein
VVISSQWVLCVIVSYLVSLVARLVFHEAALVHSIVQASFRTKGTVVLFGLTKL